MNTIAEEETPSRPNSGITINVGFSLTVPSIITFGGPSYAISSSEFSQIEFENVRVASLEYERKLAVLGLSRVLYHTPNGHLDDLVTIECTDNTNIACQPQYTGIPARVRLVMARSQLMHSDWFVNWFNSPHYLAHAGMKITWPRDPVACWEVVKGYMEDGYDRFGSNQITTYVCTNFLLDDRFMVLIRLYKLARVLGLVGLMNQTLAVLVEMEHLISPFNVLALARYIFGGEEFCEKITVLRKRCLKWVGKHYDWLLNSEQWSKVVERSVLDLGEQWTRIKVMKKMISQEELKRAIRQNVSDANAIINAVKAVNRKSETYVSADFGTDGYLSRCSISSKKDSVSTKLERNGTGKSSESESFSELSGRPATTFGGADTDENDLNRNDKTDLAIPLDRFLGGKLEGDSSKSSIIVEGKQSVRLPRTSSLQAEFGLNGKHGTASSLPASKDISIGPLNGALPCSISEPLLTLRRSPRMGYDTNGSFRNDLKENHCTLQSSTGDNDENIEQQGNNHHPLRRGVILTAEVLRELDNWPLSDVPIPDPLLPIPIAHRNPSFDCAGDTHGHSNTAVHQAQAVTVFGLHRPGMGGSVVLPGRERASVDESRAGVANVAKARELLGINEP